MRYLALATDYDGTLASKGKVAAEVLDSLMSLRKSGRKLIMVTGRELRHLIEVFPEYEMFDAIVAENGGVLHIPEGNKTELLCEPPSPKLVNLLTERCKTDSVSLGLTIVATWVPNDEIALAAIRELGLELEIIFNKGAVMILPTGVNKSTGLKHALDKLSMSSHNVVGVGDAENDHAFLRTCECSFAVANALPAVKEQVDFETIWERGAGVAEIIKGMIENDLANYVPARRLIQIGQIDEDPLLLDPYSSGVLLSGISGGGKSKATLAMLEKLGQQGYQFCLVDPEGDYEHFDNAIVTGDTSYVPTIDAVMEILSSPNRSAIVNLLGMKLEDRPNFFTELLPRIQEMRTKLGRPHWLVLDEAHHLLPADWRKVRRIAPEHLSPLLMITVHPEVIAPEILSSVNTVIAVGEQVEQTLEAFARQTDTKVPSTKLEQKDLEKGQAVVWFTKTAEIPRLVILDKAEQDKVRHKRKYADGNLPPERCFVFTGKNKKLSLRAQNLTIFLQIADGVDDETWMYHLQHRHVSKWFVEIIKDEELAAEAKRIESDKTLSPEESRREFRRIIEDRYTSAA